MFTPLTPKKIARPFGQYSHGALISKCAHMVQTSGQLGLSEDGSIPETVKEQAEICFYNIDAILSDAQMDREHIYHITAFVTERAYMAEYMKTRDEYLNGLDVFPASTLLIVSGFTLPEFKVEIQVSAAR